MNEEKPNKKWYLNVVKVHNVAQHSAGVVTAHIPEERTAEFIADLGWPTMSKPIPIEIVAVYKDASA